jgi:EIX receptor 1/2
MASFLIGKLLVPCLALLVHLIPALGFNNSGVGVGDANNVVCLEGERQALIQLKKGFVDDYGRLSSWRSEDEKKNYCNWEGVYCNNQTGHVVELHLGTTLSQPQPLRGMISSSLLELPYLTFLDLTSNDLNQSHIPEFFSSLSNLKHLDLSFANLSGPISPKLKNLSHLQYLNLGWNVLKINENLKWLSHLSSIEYLDLSSTNLNVSNDWLEVVSHLPKLKSLILSNCAHPPMSLSSLLSFNHSKSFTSLESLVLDRNQLKGGIPKFLGDICSLRELDLRFNNINGKLVDVIKNLSGCAKDSLEVLHLDFNQITGSLPNFTIFPSLEQLSLEANIINGTVPKSIGNLSKLVVLDLSNNSLALEPISQICLNYCI